MATLHLHSPKPVALTGALEPEPGELTLRLAWLVALRWRAALCIGVVIGVAAALRVVTAVGMLYALAGVHALGNLAMARMADQATEATPLKTLQNQLALQLAFDLTLLIGLLHFAGGADNPFVMLTLVHMAFAAMLLPLYKALSLGLYCVALFAAMVLAEAMGFLDHHALYLGGSNVGVTAYVHLWNSPMYTLGYLGAYALTGLTIIVLVHGLVHRMRTAEAERRGHERVAQVQERLARVGALVAGVAHTVRNPLHGVLSCVEMLQRRIDMADTNTRELLELMAEGVSRIEAVTNRLLTLTRQAKAPHALTDIAALVQDTTHFVAMRAQARGVALAVDVQPVPQVPADAERLAEALTNVIDNAVDACAAGQSVAVRVYRMADCVRMEVQDHGLGIADADLAHIFEPFFTTKPIGEGTGLGLAITRQIIEDHDGALAVLSKPGAGTTVRMDLPTQQGRGVA